MFNGIHFRFKAHGKRLAHLALLFLLAANSLPAGPARAGETKPEDSSSAQATYQVHLPLVNGLPRLISANELVNHAYKSGGIDYGTYLLYRAYILYGDPRLPQEYRGDYGEGDDLLLFEEAQNPDLPQTVRDQLHPFLVRPDHPESVYQNRPAGAAHSQPEAVGALPCDEYGWARLSSTRVAARAHTECYGNYEADLNNFLGRIEGYWPLMTALMGQPVPDESGWNGGGTPEIDFYLIPPLGEVWRGGLSRDIGQDALAVTVADDPYNGVTSSGYVLLNRERLADPGFNSDLVHEFFHVLQNGLNKKISSRRTGTGANVSVDKWWFTEASATWAETFYVPETAGVQVHPRFTDWYLRSGDDLPLHYSTHRADDNFSHLYAAYIWSLFMQQELDANAIGDAWRGIANAGTDWAAGLAAIDAQVPFETRFRDFAVRSLNQELLPGNPVNPRFIHAPTPGFPDKKLIALDQERTGLGPLAPGDFPFHESQAIGSLDADYIFYSFTNEVKQVKLDFSGIADPEIDIDVVLKPRNENWQRRQLPRESNVRLCDIEQMYLVFSHHGLEENKNVPYGLDLSPLKDPCECGALLSVPGWKGTLHFDYTKFGTQTNAGRTETVNVRRSATVQFTLDKPGQPSPGSMTWNGGMTGGNAAIHDDYLLVDFGEVTQNDKIQGSGLPRGFDDGVWSSMTAGWKQGTCVIDLWLNVEVMALNEAEAGQTLPSLVAFVQLLDIPTTPDPKPESGSWNVPVTSRTIDFITQVDLNQGGTYIMGYDWVLSTLIGENNLGLATVDWSVRPITTTVSTNP